MYNGRMSVSVLWWDVSECFRHDVVSVCVVPCVSFVRAILSWCP